MCSYLERIYIQFPFICLHLANGLVTFLSPDLFIFFRKIKKKARLFYYKNSFHFLKCIQVHDKSFRIRCIVAFIKKKLSKSVFNVQIDISGIKPMMVTVNTIVEFKQKLLFLAIIYNSCFPK